MTSSDGQDHADLMADILKGKALRPTPSIAPQPPNLMEQIREGVVLRPMDTTNFIQTDSTDPPTLLDQIREGVKLRPAAAREEKMETEDEPKEERGMMGLMMKAMAGRRGDMGMESENESEGEGEWVEEEWVENA